ncbi:unnamed protein product [Gongylonema pulchrum]|uniref:Uncharacterized protein n=1 Tax=Gongylonema pulchrum TaxID=637853 RepID=A0A3P6P9R2_9BILA|nr:unnamed protein product [Gongylonema pulchrum]
MNTDIRTCFYDVAKHDTLEDYVEFSGGHDSHDQINKRYVCARYPFVAPDGEMVTSASRPLKITLSSSGIDNKGILFLYEQFDVGELFSVLLVGFYYFDNVLAPVLVTK